MRQPRTPSSIRTLALALACALIVPVALAQEAEDEPKKSEETTEQAEPAPELRVEQGRVMTNRQGSTAVAGAPGSPGKKIRLPEGQVFTNALLDQLFGPSPKPEDEPEAGAAPAATPAQSGAAAPDPLQLMQEQVAERNQRQRLIEEARKEVEAAKAKLANLEKQLLATSNPFSARPELSEEEKQVRADSGENAKERHDRTAKQVEEARAEVKAAEERLVQLQSGS